MIDDLSIFDLSADSESHASVELAELCHEETNSTEKNATKAIENLEESYPSTSCQNPLEIDSIQNRQTVNDNGKDDIETVVKYSCSHCDSSFDRSFSPKQDCFVESIPF